MESTDTRFYGACIHQELFVIDWEAYKALRDIKTKKAAEPDGIPSVILKLFALNLRQLLPIFTTQRFVRASFLLSSRAR